ncbi:hypothetical protein N7462_008249 [Penicillium macrosclerotiorum]|uniref:uncharacterized protein n=1 Tax=Penicillium macrosclerotiorum TaxID=303699 RepID=UPI002547485B|nr:uncharacterized protein N7462_008249 [Penicillium macrosclerotiorum]KAJ5675352.1 hypothetical protein N7462_008249 [Penicillium macrosclerotiorum]
MEISGPNTQISLSFQKAAIGCEIAQEVSRTLCQAIHFLLGSQAPVKDLAGSQSLHDEFFVYRTGVHESEAREFWYRAFEGAESVQFPAIPSDICNVHIDDELHYEVQDVNWLESEYNATILIQAAWSILMTQYTNSYDVTFGFAIQEQQVPHHGLQVAKFPLRVLIDHDCSVANLLHNINAKAVSIARFRHSGLCMIRLVNEEARRACDFKTILEICLGQADDTESGSLPSDVTASNQVDAPKANSNEMRNVNEYALAVKCLTTGDCMKLAFTFDSRLLDKTQIRRMASQLSHILRQLALKSNRKKKVRDFNTASAEDIQEIWQYNSVLPAAVEACVHNLIASKTRSYPHAPAICAWDGGLTYQQLDLLSTKLAYRLSCLGLLPNMVVPLCFEKSMWTVVAILGVMKVGGVSVLLDISQPEERSRNIIRQLDAGIIVSSALQEILASRLHGSKVVTVGKDSDFIGLEPNGDPLPPVSPDNRLYIVFTSGTTGTPKGVVITHRNFCSAIYHQRDLGFTASSRVYDFASYAFDVAWSNVLHTLAAGGCLCIPSDEDRRQNLAKSIQSLKANYVDLTPTVARLLSPSDVPLITTLNLGGEALTQGTFDHWPSHVRIINAYGPAECTVVSTVAEVTKAIQGYPLDRQNHGIGKALGTVTWVVTTDEKKLAAIGAIGELWIEGPLVGQGYFGASAQTDGVFVQNPPWLAHSGLGQLGRRGRLFKTGDLVRYNTDGSLCFISRKDTQVKIHGQRVELGDIEHHVHRILSEVEDARPNHFSGLAVAEILTFRDSDGPSLVLFIYPGKSGPETESHRAVVQRMTEGLAERLEQVLPLHMVPSVFIAVEHVPMTATGKVDRGKLRKMFESQTWEDVAEMSSAGRQRRYPETPQQRQMQYLWAKVLNRDPEQISIDDNFLRIGGDSIKAMKLAGAARDKGLYLTVAQIFSHPRLGELARSLNRNTFNIDQHIPPLALLDPMIDKQEIVQKAASLCNILPDQVEDIFGCTPLQEGLLAMTTRRQGDYVARYIYDLPPGTDLPRFTESWARVITSTPILRTRIVELPDIGLMQVVVQAPMPILHGSDLVQYLRNDQARTIELGASLARFGLLSSGNNTKAQFVLTIHHSLYDGWSIPLILDAVDKAYQGLRLPCWTPFQNFIKYIDSTKEQKGSQFWKEQFEGYCAPQFPPLPSNLFHPRANSVLEHSIQFFEWRGSNFTSSTLIRTAWAILAARYMNTSETVFGVTTTGRQAAVQGIELITGPTLATTPVRIVIDWADQLENLMQKVQHQATQMISFEQTGLQNIRQFSENAKQACEFQTLLIVQPERERLGNSALFRRQQNKAEEGNLNKLENFSTYALVIECQLQERGLNLLINFDTSVLRPAEVKRIVLQLETLLRQIRCEDNHNRPIDGLEVTSEQDLRDIAKWNAIIPMNVEACVHDLITQNARERPDDPAVCSWDGAMTYSQLDILSTKLARRLLNLGLRSEAVVPLCLRKSSLVPIVMAGVMKAGGVSVAMDMTQPEDRLRSIIAQVDPKLIVTSAADESIVSRLGKNVDVIIIEKELDVIGLEPNGDPLPPVSPDNRLYIVFTSGTTGTPKGVVITHRNFCSAIYHQRDLGFTASSRVYDFASYAFDVAWSNVLHTLAAGGCLCIPSDEDRRQNLAKSIQSLKANYVELTPTVARLLSPSDVPLITTLNLGGEALTQGTFDHWPSHVRIINTYGPAECTVNSTIAEVTKAIQGYPLDRQNHGIGKALGTVTWVVTTDEKKLAAIGAIGELWIEGPLVGQGYFGASAQTDGVFVQNPPWLAHSGLGQLGRRGRLFKTGDLVRYNTDGSLCFISRKDTQVKIHGQRVELGDIEHHVHRILSEVEDARPNHFSGLAVAEILTFRDSDGPSLVLFIYPGKSGPETESHRAVVQRMTEGLAERLEQVLPLHMVPSVFIAVEHVPMTATGKVDRGKLRKMFESQTWEDVAEMNSAGRQRRYPETPQQRQMQYLWAKVLNRDPEQISIDDNFLRIGGDSIKAMQLSATARGEGLSLLVANILRYPKLIDLTKVVSRDDIKRVEDPLPFSLLKPNFDSSYVRERAISICNAEIEDIFPCTPLQEGLLSLTAQRSGDYIARFVFQLRSHVEVPRFVAIWHQMARSLPILRTRFISLPECGTLQAITTEVNSWYHGSDLEKYVAEDQTRTFEFGNPFSRTGLIKDERSSETFFVWTIHHALYDAWSIRLLLNQIQHAYEGYRSLTSTPFQNFIRYLTSINKSSGVSFWRQQFTGLQTFPFPALPSPLYHPLADQQVGRKLVLPKWNTVGFMPSVLIRCAWAIIVAKINRSHETVFGSVVSGRQAPIVDIEQIIGPTIATVPIRIKFDQDETIRHVLENAQIQAADMIAFEQFGLQKIRLISEEAEIACQFQTLLVVEPTQTTDAEPGIFTLHKKSIEATPTTLNNFSTYALSLICQLEEQGLDLKAHFDSITLAPAYVDRMMKQFEHILRQLMVEVNHSKCVHDLSLLSPYDIQEIWKWNAEVPAPTETCIHGIISDHARHYPLAPAICAWDGDLTYAQLDSLSTQLADQLVELGVKQEVLVPLCFEKSMWVPVAMLGVLKAGGAFVPLDTSQAVDRAKAILDEIKPVVAVVSKGNQQFIQQLGYPSLVPEESATAGQSNRRHFIPRTTPPHSAAYVIFTSGSTGTPKGVIIEHQAASTSLLAHGAKLGLCRASRFLQFASHSFDASIMEIFATLIYGGCVCVPSEESRLPGLTMNINDMEVNTLFLTPSVARLLQPDKLSSLTTLAIGGEAVSSSDIERWRKLPRLLEVYGPTECTILSVMQLLTANIPPFTIGKAVGSVAWVVDPNNHENLMPVGAIGELLIEGHILARGYLNDPSRTATSFINDPPWLLQGASGYPGRCGRLYKTGDLVQYDQEGRLVFIGRKDTQVKIRGQRIELGEVEHHIRECLPEVIQVAAEVIVPAGERANSMLAAFLVTDPTSQACEQTRPVAPITAFSASASIEDALAERLPSYMLGASFSVTQLARLHGAVDGEKRAPTTDLERTLQQLWARVLNIDPATIGLDDSFFRLGGDSISAMQVSAAALSLNISLTTRVILTKKTIRNLVSSKLPLNMASHLRESLAAEELLDVPFGLAPMQKLYLGFQSDAEICFDQGFLLKPRSLIKPASLAAALRTLVERHSMLRARFQKSSDGSWEQRISRDFASSIRMECLDIVDSSHMAQVIANGRTKLSIEEGPLLLALLLNVSGDQTLFLSIHHLVVDLVSWRVLLQELEEVVTLNKLSSPPPPITFQAWSSLQTEYVAKSLGSKATLPFELRSPLLSYWELNASPNSLTTTDTSQFILGSEITAALLGGCNDVFQTKPIELMLAALFYSFSAIFPDRPVPAIFSEGHGREVWDDGIDLSRTVGWFTTMFPIQIALEENPSLFDAIQQTKDSLRCLLHNGWAFFASKFASQASTAAFVSEFPVEIIFNYQGIYQQLERNDAFFRMSRLPEGCEPVSAARVNRFALFEFLSVVENGQMAFSVVYPEELPQRQKISHWMHCYEATLTEMVGLLNSRRQEWTLSDFPRFPGSYDVLQDFVKTTLPRLGFDAEEVEDIFPLSPLQEGILASQAKDCSNYRPCEVMEILCNQQNGQVDLKRLESAWQAVVQRHAILRAVLLDHLPGTMRAVHVILKNPSVNISSFSSKEIAVGVRKFRDHYNPLNQQKGLQHHLSICQGGGQRVFICLEINHVITDGHSRSIIWRDLLAAYHGNLDSSHTSYGNFISYLEQEDQAPARQFWGDTWQKLNHATFHHY